MQTKIIYEDEYVLVCHKPAGLATQSGHVGQADMVSELKRYLSTIQKSPERKKDGRKEAVPYLGVVHRLDQPVEGVLVFAKTKEAAAKLTTQLSKGSLNKQYFALVCGKPCAKVGEIVDYLVKDGNVAHVSENKHPEAKKAVLQYELVGEMTGESQETVSLLDVHIETGRFHQIRVQLAHAGMPIVSDRKYGGEQAVLLGSKLGIGNVALFAYKIEFLHPVTGKKQVFSVEPDPIKKVMSDMEIFASSK